MTHLKFLDHKDHLWIVITVSTKLKNIYSEPMEVKNNCKRINQGDAAGCFTSCPFSLNLYLKNGTDKIMSRIE